MFQGYVKVMAATPTVKVADCRYNAEQITNIMAYADGQGVEVVCFPELSITGFTCKDLFMQQMLLEEAESALLKIMDFSHNLPQITAIVGMPVRYGHLLFDAAVVIKHGRIYGVVPRTNVDSERNGVGRWFASGEQLPQNATYTFCGQPVPMGTHLVFDNENYQFAVEFGADLRCLVPPGSVCAKQGAEMVFCLGAESEMVGLGDVLQTEIGAHSARMHVGYVYSGCGYGESTQDEVFAGRAYIAECGKMLAEGLPFSMKQQLTTCEIDVELIRHQRLACKSELKTGTMECGVQYVEMEATHLAKPITLTRKIEALPFVPKGEQLDKRCEEVLCIQSEGLARRIEHTKAKTVVLGISGGLDSTLALLVCVHAFDRLGMNRKGIIGVTMPGFGTTDRTYTNALRLMESLGITIREISIREACLVHFKDIKHDVNKHDVTYENSQARERTQILMDVANQTSGFVVGTGDLSELALGWATYNGDHMSMYGVNAGVPKTLIRHIIKWMAGTIAPDGECNTTLLDIVDTPISPELIPADEAGNMQQKTEDLVGPYELHDFFLYHTLQHGFRPSKIYGLACKAFDGSDDRVGSYNESCIKKWLTIFFRRFFTAQFKRNALPDGPKIGSCSFSPRGDWQMPSDAWSTAWLEECEKL